MVELRVQFQVLCEGEFGVEGKVLRHEADAIARLQVARVERAPEKFRRAFRRRRQAGQHPHRCRLAAPVRAEESEDFAALDFEIHVIDRGEFAETFR